MGAIRYTAGHELRRSWRTVLALTLLVGVGGAVVLTLVAGARRADSSYQRFRDETFSADVSVAPSEFDAGVFDAIERLPQVAASTRPVFPFVVPADSGLYPFLDFLAYAQPQERGRPGRRPPGARGTPAAAGSCRRDRRHRTLRRRSRAHDRRPRRLRELRARSVRGPLRHRRRGCAGRPSDVGHRHGDHRRTRLHQRARGELPSSRVPDAGVPGRVRGFGRRLSGRNHRAAAQRRARRGRLHARSAFVVAGRPCAGDPALV